jgi:hypothetical protein
LPVAISCNKDVGWFDISVDDSAGMRPIQSIGQLDSQSQNLFCFKGPFSILCLSDWPSRYCMTM